MQKDEVIEFLRKIDTYVADHYSPLLGKEKFPIRIIGKCALLLAGMEDSIGTVDLDSLQIDGHLDPETHQIISTGLIEAYGRRRQAIHGYYLEFVDSGIILLPNRTKWIPLHGKWNRLSIEYLEPHHAIASKCFSAFSTPPRKKDRSDIISALDQKLVTLDKILMLADKIFDLYSMDARSERFPAVYKFITETLIPNYGGGELRFRPDEE